MSRIPRRGDVYWVTLDPMVGTDRLKARAGVVTAGEMTHIDEALAVTLALHL